MMPGNRLVIRQYEDLGRSTSVRGTTESENPLCPSNVLLFNRMSKFTFLPDDEEVEVDIGGSSEMASGWGPAASSSEVDRAAEGLRSSEDSHTQKVAHQHVRTPDPVELQKPLQGPCTSYGHMARPSLCPRVPLCVG